MMVSKLKIACTVALFCISSSVFAETSDPDVNSTIGGSGYHGNGYQSAGSNGGQQGGRHKHGRGEQQNQQGGSQQGDSRAANVGNQQSANQDGRRNTGGD